MKDLEKIKSEDLAAQVQDANPGNFAIEQEVAQLVGATVPAPTEPSADDARELGAQLLVFLRRALLPIRSALRTAVAAIYAHLDSRCTAYTPAAYDPFRLPAGPYDPMRPFAPRTLPNILTALTAFSARKISGVPEAADGMSLVHLLGGAYSDVTELTDDNRGWTCSVNIIQRILSAFPNAKTLTIGCGEYNYGSMTGNVGDKTIKFPYMTKLVTTYNFGIDITAKRVEFSEVTSWNAGSIKFTHCPDEWYMPKVTEIINSSALFQYYTGDNITLMHFGPLTTALRLGWDRDILPNCKHIEFTSGVAANLNLGYWNPTNVLADQDFLPNFREFIALRLTANGSGKTLTLSPAVRDAIHAAEATYGIEAIIVTQKGWTLSPAPTA